MTAPRAFIIYHPAMNSTPVALIAAAVVELAAVLFPM
jgi:hypothetical protein